MTRHNVPTAEQCVLRNLVERWARETPNSVYATFDDGSQLSYSELLRLARRTGHALQSLGVKQGDAVLVWLPNGSECLRAWFGINMIGAVYVPINTAYRGGILQHVVGNAGATLAIVHGSLLQRLADIDKGNLRKAVVIDGEPAPIEGLDVLPATAIDSPIEDAPVLEHPIAPWDTQCIIYTSGTTGPSKGVLSSYAHLYATGRGISADCDGIPYLSSADTFMVNLPLFHVGGTGPSYAMLINGGSIAMVDRFDTGSFWSTVSKTKTTMVILLGVMASFLIKRDDNGDEADATLRHVTVIPLSEEGIAFGRRYGVTTHTLFNMSEVSCPLVAEPNPTVAASCGRPRAGVEARLVDPNDSEVPQGAIGELIIRTDAPWAMNHGYNKAPEATALAWRNGWFHTGDAFRIDKDGNYFFVDRFKDAIRRRGENISSFEVELEVAAHPSVREAAAVSVPSEHGEDDVLVAVSLAEGKTLDPAELIQFLRPRMAHFMVPRYVRILADLPKTPTNKVEKYLLRRDGVTSETFDRDAVGLVIRSEPVRSGH
ncbi:AMP-binding protein [Bradyrhizobium jicamae]|uniref:AMP-binding protein n=1 Tax=Bradyrhizobium jicamae TaxID=280332 RepID=A0ABS5FTP4_9BRAD|nr:AMP-binding protein [Bradyrhizobium jicamae]MBR0799636.1 AMP-binding protein [Bradyrhizobium jicamae]MBR0934294.1 AMP-binding protein [Bradyrhizobium jicamae]